MSRTFSSLDEAQDSDNERLTKLKTIGKPQVYVVVKEVAARHAHLAVLSLLSDPDVASSGVHL